ncbi:MAG TPA: aminotransferase class III-fold pyridoxal phosphate-dependent enzyme [Vicinamibacterales bacterium]|nr:aminotransferase class III-fold pyridoxal phosphate-dependent enzyme [Vicinamibacterales bacterium]
MSEVAHLERSLPVITRSDEWYARATGLIPGHTQTLAKGPGQYVAGVAPKYLQRGKGSHVWDVDGNEFIDFSMAIGPLSLGYGYPAVDRAIREQLEDGITFSMMHPLEVEVAELIREVVPNAEMVRYSKTGADVTSAAVRLARAFTGRSKVICCGYHGWHDWYISVTDRSVGVPTPVHELTGTFDYNDLQSVNDLLDDDTACAILEPMIFDEPRGGFLHELKGACRKNGTLLVFDEMWTGFRFALGGAQERFGVQADLMCYSKAIANGMPLAVLAGRADVMRLCEKNVFFFTTFGGEALSLAAAKATIHELRDCSVPAYLARQGRVLRDGYNTLARHLDMPYTQAIGADCRSLVTFDARAGDPLEMKSLVQQELLARGILWSGFHNMSFSHTDDDVAHALAAYREALMVLKQAVESGSVRQALLGSPVEPVFRRTSNATAKRNRT